ncbi:hypothetical protein AVEN_173704-1 [Araneus ventricosus]|uniref:Uncharacterized protein n=1 Tax=Araneus ventricosus TaxID=182803 RepID=A0A4Y2PCF0_ARAVE|nr:hypothetical protein AVEN_173704-1 [Araneus ventricosus]
MGTPEKLPSIAALLASRHLVPDSNYVLFELNKWTLPGLQKQRTMAKCIASEAEHRALSEDKNENILHLP